MDPAFLFRSGADWSEIHQLKSITESRDMACYLSMGLARKSGSAEASMNHRKRWGSELSFAR